MKAVNVTILFLTISFVTGLFASTFIDVAVTKLLYAVVVIVFVAILFHIISLKRPRFRLFFTIVISLTFFSIGLFRSTLNNPLLDTKHYTHSIEVDSIYNAYFEVDRILKPSAFQTKYYVSLLHINEKQRSGKLLLNVDKDSTITHLKIGSRYHARAPIFELPKVKNPHQFDYGGYLEKQDIYGQLFLAPSEVFESAEQSEGFLVRVARFRESIQSKLKSYNFTPSQLGIINALLLGQRQDVDRTTNEAYAAAGMIHILAVSGLHVGILLILLRWLVKPLFPYEQRWMASMIIILSIWGFAFFTGASPSVLRAATMFTFFEIGSIINRRSGGYNSLLYSAFLLLLIDPDLVYQVGFQMSYLAVFAILWLQPTIYGWYHPKFFVDRKIWEVASVSIAAQIGVLPLSLFYFHQFPGLFLLSNVVVIPFLGYLLGAGILVIALAILDMLPDFLVSWFGKTIDLLNEFIQWIAHQESFVIKHITINVLEMLVVYASIISIGLVLRKYTYTRFIVVLVSILVCIGAFGYGRSKETSEEFIVFHAGRSTLVGERYSQDLRLVSSDSLYDPQTDYKVNAIADGTRVKSISTERMRNVFRFKRKNILLIDSLGIYSIPQLNPDFIILTQSPKVNLNRLLDAYPQTTIIADGSNYKSFVDRWKKTCNTKKIPFHSTYEKGAYIIK